MSINNNRNRGNGWERECVVKLRPFFPHAVTSRSESKARDDAKVDIMNHEEDEHGRIPYNFQCKTTVATLNYAKILESMPKNYPNIILHKRTVRKGKSFSKVGEYVIMDMDTFLKFLRTNENPNT